MVAVSCAFRPYPGKSLNYLAPCRVPRKGGLSILVQGHSMTREILGRRAPPWGIALTFLALGVWCNLLPSVVATLFQLLTFHLLQQAFYFFLSICMKCISFGWPYSIHCSQLLLSPTEMKRSCWIPPPLFLAYWSYRWMFAACLENSPARKWECFLSYFGNFLRMVFKQDVLSYHLDTCWHLDKISSTSLNPF